MLDQLPPDEDIVRRRAGAVEWIVFNRPQALNALTHAMEEKLTRIFREMNSVPSVRAVVLTGAPGRKPAFMAGADMGDLQDAVSVDNAMRMEETSEEMLTALEEMRAPVVAAMAGACVGVGALIASACDVRLASASLRFGFPIARTVGNCLSLKNFARLASVLGPARTKDLVFDPTLLGGQQAAAVGAAKECLPSDEALLQRAQVVAENLARLAPMTLWGTKESLRRLRDAAIPTDADDLVMACYLSEDYQEATAAFLAKRAPIFTGR
jgi:enoyl-CoA hydratase/carnithine racemase